MIPRRSNPLNDHPFIFYPLESRFKVWLLSAYSTKKNDDTFVTILLKSLEKSVNQFKTLKNYGHK